MYAIFLISSHLLPEPSHAKINAIPVQESEYTHHAEGFLAGTLVATPSGYHPIEHLNIDDLICGQDESQSILFLKKTTLDSYFEIQINNTRIQTAPYQKLYMHDETLKDACELQIGDILVDQSCVLSVQQI